MFAVVLLLASSARAASPAESPDVACTDPRPGPALVDAALAGAEAAWGVDEASFGRSVANARQLLRCVSAPLSPAMAARYHRVEGLAAFLADDAPRAAQAFAAARAVDPAYSFPTTMVPAQNPVRVAYDGATSPPGEETLPRPARGVALWVDGAETRARPTGRPIVLQLATDGSLENRWLLPGDPLPDYPHGRGARTPLLVGAGVLAAGAGVLWGFGADARQDFYDAPTRHEALGYDTKANQLGVAAVAVGAAAVATGTSAFLVARW